MQLSTKGSVGTKQRSFVCRCQTDGPVVVFPVRHTVNLLLSARPNKLELFLILAKHRKSDTFFQLLKNMCYCSLLVLKGTYDYLFFPGAKTQMEALWICTSVFGQVSGC